MIRKLFSDFAGIIRTCGLGRALQWGGCVIATMPQNLRSKNLLAADRLMGNGPFLVRHRVGSAMLTGEQAFSGVREIWVRDVYGRDGFLQIPPNGTIIDLGANMGNFSALGLAASSTARLIGVEPSSDIGAKWTATIAVNKFGDRAQLCRAFIGIFTPKQTRDFTNDPAYSGAPIIDESEFLKRYNINHIDFLKCDIEGSEFFLTNPESKILDITDRLAIEIHDFGGDPHYFLNHLKDRGFSNIQVDWYGAECIARATRTTNCDV